MLNKPMWKPSKELILNSNMARFMEFAGKPYGVNTYNDIHKWSVDEGELFWQKLLNFTEIIFEGELNPVIESGEVPGNHFFPNLKLNFAENLLRFNDEETAVISISESRDPIQLTYSSLRKEVARVAAGLLELKIQPGNRVAGFIPNTLEALIAMLATTSIGAVWTSCSPDFGVTGVLDRFGQVKPRVLFAANGYKYNGKNFDCMDKIEKIAEAISQIEKIVISPFLKENQFDLNKFEKRMILWDDFGKNGDHKLEFKKFPFNHPLYIMYSSGTTGLPKCIVHCAGGTLLQHAKELILHTNLTRQSKIFYFTTCGWMMWNWLVSSLFTGCSVVLYDGSPVAPDTSAMWELVEEESVTHFGTSPKFIGLCKGKISPKKQFGFKNLKVLLSTGAPLLAEDFDWIYSDVKEDLQVSSISGGTDIISCFMLGNPILPVYRGEIQCIGLGMDVSVFNDKNEAVFHEKGELVCRKPFVSMPLYFWNDLGNRLYKKAYFSRMDKVWFHGDYVCHTLSQGSSGGLVVYGRSDTTLNPGGVRIGTAEIYRLVENIPEIEDSIVIGEPHNGDIRVILFVKLVPLLTLNEELKKKIKVLIKDGASPKHVPDKIVQVQKIPYTISGKKVELAVLDIIMGNEPKNRSALADPDALECYRNIKEQF